MIKYMLLGVALRIRRAWILRKANRLIARDKNMARRYMEYQKAWIEAMERKLQRGSL